MVVITSLLERPEQNWKQLSKEVKNLGFLE